MSRREAVGHLRPSHAAKVELRCRLVVCATDRLLALAVGDPPALWTDESCGARGTGASCPPRSTGRIRGRWSTSVRITRSRSSTRSPARSTPAADTPRRPTSAARLAAVDALGEVGGEGGAAAGGVGVGRGVEDGADDGGADDDPVCVAGDLDRLVPVGDAEPDPTGRSLIAPTRATSPGAGVCTRARVTPITDVAIRDDLRPQVRPRTSAPWSRS